MVIATACGRRWDVSPALYSSALEIHETLYKGHPNAVSCLWTDDMLEFEVVFRGRWITFVATDFGDITNVNEDAVMLVAVVLLQTDEGVTS